MRREAPEWKFFTKVWQNEKKKWTSTCNYCGCSREDIGPQGIREHFGFDAQRDKEKKYATCRAVANKTIDPEAYNELRSLHEAAIEQKQSKRRRVEQKEKNDQIEEDAEFVKDGVNPDAARSSAWCYRRSRWIVPLHVHLRTLQSRRRGSCGRSRPRAHDRHHC